MKGHQHHLLLQALQNFVQLNLHLQNGSRFGEHTAAAAPTPKGGSRHVLSGHLVPKVQVIRCCAILHSATRPRGQAYLWPHRKKPGCGDRYDDAC
jgi:hypothetical protein